MKRVLLSLVPLLILAGRVAAAEPRVLFEDRFDKKPGDGWTWLRENPDAWRIQDGALEIRVEPGNAETVKNALVRTAPDRSKEKFAVEVTITFTSAPTQQFEQAGITWYQDDKPVFKLVHERIDGELWIIPGRQPAAPKTVQLRLLVDGRKWTAQFRPDPAQGEFKTAAEGELPPAGNDKISLQCYQGPPDSTHWIRFDDFRIVQLAN
jgi:hypothetical protein